MKRCVDLFCGAGGTSTGVLMAAAELGQRVDLLAINHWNVAIDTHTRNHPNVRHLCESLDNVDPRKASPGALHLLCGSPECTHHSNARGGKPCSDQSRASAWHLLRWAEAKQPRSILIENVREFRNWGPLDEKGRPLKRRQGETFKAFLNAIASLGYHVDHRLLNAADYGDATTRTRLFVMARRDRKPIWPQPSHVMKWRAAREIIDWSIQGQPIHERARALSPNTMRRIEVGLKRFGGAFVVNLSHGASDSMRCVEQPLFTITTAKGGELGLAEPFVLGQQSGAVARSVREPLPTISTGGAIALIEPFLVNYYGSSTVTGVDSPLPTVTTRDRFGLVESGKMGIRFRMLRPHELAAAMSFPAGYEFAGTQQDHVKQIGNAVPVRTACALAKSLLQ